MTLVATYDEPEARVELVTTGLLTAGATIFTIERGPTVSGPWTGVRGAVDQVATTNSAESWFDYEYTPGPDQVNYYRVRSKTPATFVNFGTMSTAYTGGPDDLTPGLPASIAVGDVMVMVVTVSNACNNEDGAWPLNISGWTLVNASDFFSGNPMAIYLRVATASESAPSFSRPSSSGLGTIATAQMAAFRYVRPVVLANAFRETGQPASTSQVGFPALASLENHSMFVSIGTTVDPWTSVAATATWTQIDDAVSTDRNMGGCTSTASLAWQYLVQGAASDIAAGVMVITGGTHSTKLGATLALSYDPTNAPASTLFSDDVDTPLEEVWLKDPLRPPRNMVVSPGRPEQIRHAARSGLFDIKGRTDPIEISERRRAVSWVQSFAAETFTEADGLLELFETGGTLLLHVPGRGEQDECPISSDDLPGGYIHVGDVAENRSPDGPLPRVFAAPVQTVAAPAPELDYLEVPVP